MYGCIDIGSNTTRLLVAEVNGGRVRALAARRIFTRIGAGGPTVDRREKIAETAQVAAALAAEAADMGAARHRAAGHRGRARGRRTATSCARPSSRRPGCPMRVLSGDEEAQLSFAGARQGLEDRVVERLGVVDVGGGSTELAAGAATGPAGWSTSLPIGSGSLAAATPRTTRPPADASRAWHAAAAAALEQVQPAARGPDAGRRRHRHVAAPAAGPRLTATSLRRALERLCAHPAEEAARRLELDPERVRLLPAGITVLTAVAARLGRELRIARGGLREGAVLELAGRRAWMA